MVVVYYLGTMATFGGCIWAAWMAVKHGSEGMAALAAVFLVFFGVMMIGAWNLAAHAEHCCP